MSDLKLYNSINKINDALIEEAACTEKPVIHHCYGIAASAAAVFIAVGALGLFHASGSFRKTDLSTNTPVIGQNTTETVTATTTPAISDETIQTSSVEAVPLTTQVPMTSAQAFVSYSKTSTIPQNSQNQTSAFSAVSSAAAVTSSAEYISAEMNTVSTADAETVTAVTTEAVTPYDYNYYNEGRVIMKRFAALSSALLMLPNVSAVNSGAAEPLKYTRSDKYPDNINNFITCIEEYDLNIDINGDGKFDIFDAYAVDHLYSEGCPEYIVDNINECNAKINEFISETGNYASIYDITEYFVYTQPVKLEYFDPNFYIDNCPDIYNEPIPLEYIRHDDGEFDIVDFYDTEFYEENDGTFERLKYHQSRYINKKKSSIHQFIESRLQPAMCYTNASYNIMSELMDKGIVDADINSDGVFNYDDIMMLYYFQDLFYDDYYETHYGYWDEDDEYHSLESGPIHEKNRTYEGFLENYELLSSCYPEWSYLTNHKLSESEWEKATKFYDIESMYTLRCVADINQSLFIYYITNYNNIFSLINFFKIISIFKRIIITFSFLFSNFINYYIFNFFSSL